MLEGETTDDNDGIGPDEAASVQVIFIELSLKLRNGPGILFYV